MLSDDGVGLMHNFVIWSEWEKGHSHFSGTPGWREVVCAVSWQQRKTPTAALNSPGAAVNSASGTKAVMAVIGSPVGIKFMQLTFWVKAAWKHGAQTAFSVRPIALTALLLVQNWWDLCWLFTLTSLSGKDGGFPTEQDCYYSKTWRRVSWVVLFPLVLSSIWFPGVAHL